MIPVVATDRLRLRAPHVSDFEAYAAFWAGARGAAMGGPFSRAQAWDSFAADAGHWLLRGFGQWIVELRSSGVPAGWVGFYKPDRYEEVELGWVLFDTFEGQGIAFEAAQAARDYGAQALDIRAPASFIFADNRRSIALAERLGAVREATRDRGAGLYHVYRHPMPEALQ